MTDPHAPPLVAVTATIDALAGRERVRLNAAYTRALERAGLLPLVVPPLAQPGEAAALLGAVRGLVLTGGEDVDPARYGAPPHSAAGRARVRSAPARRSSTPTRACTSVAFISATTARRSWGCVARWSASRKV